MKSAALLGLILALVFSARAADPIDVSARTSITTANAKSTLDRTSNRISSSVDVTIKNIGDRPLEAPLHAVVTFTAQSGTVTGIQVPGASGGLGVPPYGAFFFDLGSQIPAGGIAAGASVTFPLRFTPAANARVTFAITPRAVANTSPTVNAGGPYTGTIGQAISFSSAGTVDADGDPLTFSWDFGDGSALSTASSPQHPYTAAGIYDAVLTARDNRGGVTTDHAAVTIAPATPFALARIRTLDGSGQPLGGVEVAETVGTETRTFSSQERTGFASLGSGSGDFGWKFSKGGYLPVWREATLANGAVALTANPWLARENTQTTHLSPLNDNVIVSPSLAVRVQFPAGAFPQPAEGVITDLSAQNLPFPLPLGWSPIAEFHLTVPPPQSPGDGTLALTAQAGGTAAFVRFDEATRSWMVLGTMPATASVSVPVPGEGSYALVVADGAPFAPPAAEVGQALTGTTQTFTTAGVTATGSVTPAVSVASLDAASVTGTARVTFTAPSPMPSGIFFPTRVSETYELASNASARVPDYDTTVFAYRQPASALAAEFPMRPQLLFGPEELKQATVRCAVLAPGQFTGAVLDNGGGVLGGDGIRVTVPGEALNAPQAAELAVLDPQTFTGLLGGVAPAKAFGLSLGNLAGGKVLGLAINGLAPNALYVLALAVTDGVSQGFAPVERFTSDAGGLLVSAEPATGPRLPGASSGGEYVLIQVPSALALVQGIARDAGGSPAGGLAVRVKDQPWLVFSAADGRYKTLAPGGAGLVTLTDGRDGNEGATALAIVDPSQPQDADVTTAPTPPRVASVDPAAGAINVPRISGVTVRFSEPILGFGPDAVILRDAAGATVAGSLTLNFTGTEATLLPASPLEAGADYQIEVSAGLKDRTNLALAGTRLFSFTTAREGPRPAGAQLIVYEPGAKNIPAEVLAAIPGFTPGADASIVVAQGTQGVADPGVPVVLVNQNTGETSTVLSKPDGSFAGLIRADEADFISAVFVNANGTRLEVRATRQLFDDGRTGLYRQGGILEAQGDGGPVQVIVEPESIEDRVKFRVDPVQLTKLLTALQGSLPADAQLLGGVAVANDVDGEVTQPAHISFPLDRAALHLPPGVTRAEDATFLLTRAVQDENGTTVYEVLDTMKVEGDRLVTKSPPYEGLLFKKVLSLLKKNSSSFKKLNVANSLLNSLGLPGIQETLTHQLLLPFMMIFAGTTTDVIGNVSAVQLDAQGNEVGAKQPVIGAVVSIEQAPGPNTAPLPPPGRLRAGEFVTVSRAPDGFFVLRLDATLNGTSFEVSATHPRFPGIRATDSGAIGTIAQRFKQGDITRLDLLFGIAAATDAVLGPDVTAPQIRASHTPAASVAGLGDAAGAVLLVAENDDRTAGAITAVKDSVVAFGQQALNLESDVVLVDDGPVSTSAAFREQQFHVRCARPGRVTIRINAVDGGGNATTQTHVIDFARAPLVLPTGGSDTTGPRVTFSSPQKNAVNVAAFPEIQLRFSEPLPPEAFQLANADWVQFSSGHYLTAIEPSADRRDVKLHFAGPPTGPVSLTIGSPLTDAAGNPFDQEPALPDPQSFALDFTLAETSFGNLNLQSGGGVAGGGVELFALDRRDGVGAGELVAFDVSDPGFPIRQGSIALPERPTDLVFLPHYSIRRTLTAQPETLDLVVVVGGANGGAAFGEVGTAFKWMRVIDVSDPSQPTRLAGGILSQDPTALVVKLEAALPILAFQINSGDTTSVHLVDLPAFVIGHNATPDEINHFPDQHTPGVDLNGDGDYSDLGETVALPARAPATFFGDFFSFAPPGIKERIVDFDLSSGGLAAAITFDLTTQLTTYRNLFALAGTLDENAGALPLNAGEEGKRVFVLDSELIRVAGVLEHRPVALVSLRPTGSAGPKLVVIDLTDPNVPKRIGEMPLDPADGIPQSLTPRDDGRLALAMSHDILVLDPARLLEVDAAGRSLAIVERLSGVGGGVRTFVADAAGLAAIAAGNNNAVLFNGPRFSFVTLSGAPVPAQSLTSRPEAEKASLLASALPAPILRKARIQFTQPSPQAAPQPSAPQPENHYYVVCRMPGSAMGLSTSLPLMLASVNDAGVPPSVSAGANLPSLLADPTTISALAGPGADATPNFPTQLNAFRLSDSPGSPLYNVFLAGPFTLHSSLNKEQAAALTAQLPRAFLRINQRVVVSLPPPTVAGTTGPGNFINPFRSQLTAGVLRQGTSFVAPVEYVRNPLIFVHGVLASTLSDGSALPSFDFWVPLFHGLVNPSALTKLVLKSDGTSEAVFPTDILRSVLPFGVQDIQGKFLDFLHDELGYREYTWDYKGKNEKALRLDGDPNWPSLTTQPDLFPFPYDWRKDNAFSAQRLAKYVELIHQALPDAEHVDIVAHSMGGLVSRRYILDHPGEVENLITIASPLLGATKAIGMAKTGDFGEFALNFLLGTDLAKSIARFMPALHQLMPNKGLFDLGFKPVVEDGWDADGNGKAHEAYDYTQYKKVLDGALFHEAGLDDPLPISKDNEPLNKTNDSSADHNNGYDWSGDNGPTRYYHIVTLQQMPRTVSRVHLVRAIVPTDPTPEVGLAFPPLAFEESERLDASEMHLDPIADLPVKPGSFKLGTSVRIELGAGDGTVPLLSATRGFGAGPGHDLNSPNAVMTAIISQSTADADDKAASHVDIMHHRKLFDMVARILTSGLERSELPKITISADSATEGQTMGFSATISGPVPAGEQPVIIWETGDGRTVSGASGSHVYGDSGDYTLTCVAYYPVAGVGSVASRQITVANALPQVTIVADPPHPKPGELVSLTAITQDGGVLEEHQYEWQFDGTTDSDLAATAFTLRRVFAEPGSYLIHVKVTDDHGASGTADTTLNVGTPPVAPLAAAAPAAPGASADPSEGEPVEFVDVGITGHETGIFSTVVQEDSGLVSNILLGALADFRGLVSELNAPGDETLRILRVPPSSGGSLPTKASVQVTATDKVVVFRARYVSPSGLVRSFRWEVPTATGSIVKLTLPWTSLATVAEPALSSFTSITPTSAKIIPSDGGDEPTLVASRDETTQTFTLASLDRAVIDGAPVTDTEPIGIIETLADPTMLDGAPVTLLSGSAVETSSLPTDTRAIVNIDSRGEATISTKPVKPAPTSRISAQQITETTDAIKAVFTQGAASSLFADFVLAMNDVLLFEQGTGASLWKNNPDKCAYVPTVSDNDYQLFLPIFKLPPVPLDPSNPTQQREFAAVAHYPTYLLGDWYFKPPEGVDASGRAMGVIPDFVDTDAYSKYLAVAKKWRYSLPAGLQTLSNKTGFVEVDRSSDPVFANPLPPGDVISYVFTQTVKADPALSSVLKEISFFPNRREHFFFGVPTLEKPPGFGDDPLGDAGMGRGLLFLKWCLEGVFLPEFGSGDRTFNVGMTSQLEQQIRTEIHDRLVARQIFFAPECYEWGAYQEFAILSDGATLRMAPKPPASSLRFPPVFGNYTDAQNEKIMKKVGKAAIRGALGKLVFDQSTRGDVYAEDPLEFDGDPNLRTFEDYAARLAKAHLGSLGNVPQQDIDDYLGAKLADATTFKRIREQPGGVDAFILKGFDFLRQQVQQPSANFYVGFLDNLETAGRVYEADMRLGNAKAVDYGISTAAGLTLPGRKALFGLEGDASVKYSFGVTLQARNQTGDVGPLTLKLIGGTPSEISCPNLTIPAGKSTLKIDHKNADKQPAFTVFESVRGGGGTTRTFVIDGLTPSNDTDPKDNTAEFESQFLHPSSFFVPEFAPAVPADPTRWVYRGIHILESDLIPLIVNELAAGFLESDSERAGLNRNTVRDAMAALLDADLSFGPFHGFTAADALLMTNEEKAALRHTDALPTGMKSLGISTAEDINTALRFSNIVGDEKAYLIVLEVPLSQGLEYLPNANGAARRINDEEGNEVVYLGKCIFKRALLFEITAKGTLPDSRTLQHLQSFP